MAFQEVLSRVSEIRSAPTPDAYIKQRVVKSAQELSKAGELQARCEVITEAMFRFVDLIFQSDTDGQLANVDPVTYRLLVPAPWGGSGWQSWGLRHWEGVALRGYLMDRCRVKGKRPPLFDYSEVGRTWSINLVDYPNRDAALFFLQREPLTVSRLRELSSKYKATRAKVVGGHRSRVKDGSKIHS